MCSSSMSALNRTPDVMPVGLVPAVVVAAVVVLSVCVAAVLPVNLRLVVERDAVVIEPRGMDIALTLRRRIRLPLGQITGVRVVPRAQVSRPGLRLPGTSIPGVVTAGSYGLGQRRQFWDVRRADTVLVISCTAAAPCRELVLEFADPHLVETQLREALGS